MQILGNEKGEKSQCAYAHRIDKIKTLAKVPKGIKKAQITPLMSRSFQEDFDSILNQKVN